MNSSVLIEIKKEYIYHLKDIISPLLHQKLTNIYKKSTKNKNSNLILKTFQNNLKQISLWDKSIIDNEVKFIINNTLDYPYLVNLIKSLFLVNIKLLSIDSLPIEYYNGIKINNFFHSIYIECARCFWNKPYLFYDKIQAIEIKKNQNIIQDEINMCIDKSLRKLLPMNMIVNSLLGPQKNDPIDIELNINKADVTRIDFLLNKNITINNFNTPPVNIQPVNTPPVNIQPVNTPPVYIQPINTPPVNIQPINTPPVNIQPINTQLYNKNSSEKQNSKINSDHNNNLFLKNDQILSIINKNNLSSNTFTKKSQSTLNKIVNNKASNNNTKNISIIDSEVKKDLKKNLSSKKSESYKTYSDSLTKSRTNNNNYIDVYSNSHSESTTKQTLNTSKHKEINDKAKFFNNYLNY